MANDRERTACCGLYCGDCIPANHSLFDTAARLKEQLENCQFDKYAQFKSMKEKPFEAYQTFREVLDAILALRCPQTCFHGGGNPDCAIRACVRENGLEGCWRCASFETCGLLEPLCAGHGDTVRHNLRIIRQHGVENWSHSRGKHYIWQEPDRPQRELR